MSMTMDRLRISAALTDATVERTFSTADRPQLRSATHRVRLPRPHQSMITAVPEAVTMSIPLSVGSERLVIDVNAPRH